MDFVWLNSVARLKRLAKRRWFRCHGVREAIHLREVTLVTLHHDSYDESEPAGRTLALCTVIYLAFYLRYQGAD